MHLIFMGTPDFAVPSLEKLIERGDEILAVLTQPDKPKGRGHKLQAPPVKELALQYGLPVWQPVSLRNEEIQEKLRELKPEAIVVAAYGKILPKAVLDIPSLGCINVHGSLLPKYRGAAPIQWTVINGDAEAGVTTMLMAEGLDTGPMLLKASTAVGPEETSGELFDRLKVLGAQLLDETLQKLEAGVISPISQKEEEATQAPMLSKTLSFPDWTLPAQKIHDLIRGLNPWPGTVVSLQGKRLKLWGSRVTEGAGEPGSLDEREGQLLVYCGENALLLTELQTENGKRMSGKDYLLGHPLQKGTRFEAVSPQKD